MITVEYASADLRSDREVVTAASAMTSLQANVQTLAKLLPANKNKSFITLQKSLMYAASSASPRSSHTGRLLRTWKPVKTCLFLL